MKTTHPGLLCALLAMLAVSCTEAPQAAQTPPHQGVGLRVRPAVSQAYARQVESRMVAALNKLRMIGILFSITMQIWVAPSGKIERLEFTTRDSAADNEIRAALADLDVGPAPPGIPMPITLRMRARPGPS